MKITHSEVVLDENSSKPIMKISAEIKIEEMQEAISTMVDFQLEQFVGRQFLKAFEEHKKSKSQVQDVTFREKQEEVNGTEEHPSGNGSDGSSSADHRDPTEQPDPPASA